MRDVGDREARFQKTGNKRFRAILKRGIEVETIGRVQGKFPFE